jgi:hypothetical protein
MYKHSVPLDASCTESPLYCHVDECLSKVVDANESMVDMKSKLVLAVNPTPIVWPEIASVSA